MLKLCLATSLEVLHASVGRKACWIPETNGRLHTKLILKGTQRRSCVVGPVTPGASSQAILKGRLQSVGKKITTTGSVINNQSLSMSIESIEFGHCVLIHAQGCNAPVRHRTQTQRSKDGSSFLVMVVVMTVTIC